MTKHVIRATIFDKRGRILSTATNNYLRSHPIQARFAKAAGEPLRVFLHAEIAALIKLKENDRPYHISVERYTKDGKPALAAPCAVCLAAIKHYNLVKIEHTL